MNPKIAIALRRQYHCTQARLVLQQNALPYPVYHLGESDTAPDVLQRIVDQGTEILVTGDVYAESILNQLDISVVTIRRSKLQFSDTIREALKLTDHTALVWRETDSTAAKKACQNYPGSITFHPYQSREELEQIFFDLNQSGLRIVIGAGVCNPIAEKYGITIINVPYDESDILTAIRLAEHNLKAIEDRREHAEMLSTIQDNISEGIVALDANGRFQTLNRAAATLLGMDPRVTVGLPVHHSPLNCQELHRLLTSHEPFSGKMVTINGTNLVLEGQPVLVHAVLKSAILTLTQVEKLQNTEQRLRRQLLGHTATASIHFRDIVGSSPALKQAIQTAQSYAKVDSPVLVYGQSGTGKEMFVQSIHNASKRKNGPFVVINCAALPENLIESELFGYEKGAFTGALNAGKQGLFVKGHQGTVFLDEVSEMPLHVQARFLRVLQEHEVTPIGSLNVISVDIRVIAATNKDLRQMVKEKKFREDLYYRISVLSMKLPPLSERGDDIVLLIRHFIKQKSQELGLSIRDADPAAIRYLAALPYPGNIRQLSNIVERSLVLCEGDTLDLAAVVKSVSMSEDEGFCTPQTPDGSGSALDSLSNLQEEIIREALSRNQGSRQKTARELGISTSTLYRRMKQFGMIES